MHIGDRENDIYELFCTAGELGARFLMRTCVDRLAGDDQHTIADEMAEGACGVYIESSSVMPWREIRGATGNQVSAGRVLPPIGTQKMYPQLDLTVLHAQERDAPAGREPLRSWVCVWQEGLPSLQVSISNRDLLAKVDELLTAQQATARSPVMAQEQVMAKYAGALQGDGA